MSKRSILLGNEAIARGIVEAGCEIATAYPGTPSSEILPAVAVYSDQLGTKTAVEWGANEKVAYEMAVSASFGGKRTCCIMKQVGLNVAADPFMSTAHFDLKGGFLLVVSDDPGPHSSQTEQDSRYFAMFAKVPCFDPSTAEEAKEMVFDAYDLSERHGIVTMLRPTGKVDHARQDVPLRDEVLPPRKDEFKKDPKRWVCLPAGVKVNHPRLNDKNDAIRSEFEENYEKYNYVVPAKGAARLGIIAGGTTFAFLSDMIRTSGRDDIEILKIGTPVPLPVKLCEDFIARHEKVLILEQTYPVIETQLNDRNKIMGRWNGFVPRAGELLPELIEEIIAKCLGDKVETSIDEDVRSAMEEMHITPRPPMLCPGCPHRASFFAIRKALPKAINPSDIGCYTLGIMQKGIDSAIDMGAAVTAASGFCLASKVDGEERPVVATIGDSTFFHSGLTGLASAVYNRHAFVLAILDNRITAMTGGQSSPNVGTKLRKGDQGVQIDLEQVCRGCGVSYIKTVEAYDVDENVDVVKDAWAYAWENKEPAVLIFKHPCITILKEPPTPRPVRVDPEVCIGCKYCITSFNCPGLVFDESSKKAYIDERYCVNCGVCMSVCPHGAIVSREEA
ncbi:MAG: indolepyruvate ferredoxin oxidoreductase subunit alpha [Synergistota bacterium]|nr:indolepyruvate ferredoxin oxidoreductase subunit alpha [Synergistota bacterium]